MTALVRAAVSIRTTVVLIVMLSLLLLASVLVPQRALIGEAAARSAAANGAGALLVSTLGLDAIATSPLFVGVLVLFYVNLVAVMVDRFPRILGKMRVQPPTPESLEKWIASGRAIEGESAAPIAPGSVVAILRGFGFRPQGVTPSAMYAVKGRSAAAGFLVFHVSFLFLCAGGLLIWYTRFVGEMRVVEGQRVQAKDARVVRRAPVGELPDVAFTLEKMVPTFDRGEAVDLRATLRVEGGAPVEAWVNHPASVGPTSLLVTDVGLAPAFWLQDRDGFGVDRVAAPADRGAPVDVPLAAGIVTVRVLPRAKSLPFPGRELLASLPVDVEVREGNAAPLRATLRPGEALPLRDGRLVLTEVRYWAGVRVIRERGGALLVAGFLLATIGATWRLLLRRRDLVVAWSGTSFRVAGHGEWFNDRDRRELMGLAAALEKSGAAASKEVEVRQ